MNKEIAAIFAVIVILASLTGLASSSFPSSSSSQQSNAHRIVCIGDSITKGFTNTENWPYYLQTRLGGDWIVINEGVGGETTTQMLYRIDSVLHTDSPHFVIIAGGVNNRVLPSPVSTAQADISAMCNKTVASGAIPILCTITPYAPSPEVQAMVEAINTWLTQYAFEHRYAVIDFYTILNDPANPGHMKTVFDSGDNLHPNNMGQEAMADGIDLGIFIARVDSAPAVCAQDANNLDFFVNGTDGALWWKHWNGTVWSSWTSLGGYLTSDPAAVSQGAGKIDVFVRGSTGELWQREYNNGWGSWTSLGGYLAPGTGPAACSWGAGRLDVFVEGRDGALWHQGYHGTWDGWESRGGYLTASPAATSPASGVIDVFVRGGNGDLWQKEYNNGWHDWTSLGGYLAPGTGPAACSWGSGRLDVSVVGTDRALWHQSYDGHWSGWESLGGYVTASPAATSPTSGTIDVFVRGSTGALWQKQYNNGWSGWTSIGGM